MDFINLLIDLTAISGLCVWVQWFLHLFSVCEQAARLSVSKYLMHDMNL